jgi:PAS domain S-box-containing protein
MPDDDPAEMFDAGWEMFRALARNAPIAIFATDTAGRHLFVNTRWCELTGMAAEQALGSGWEGAVHPDDMPAALRQWRRLMTHGDGLWTRLRIIRQDGRQAEVIMHAAAAPTWDGRRRFVGTLTVPHQPRGWWVGDSALPAALVDELTRLPSPAFGSGENGRANGGAAAGRGDQTLVPVNGAGPNGTGTTGTGRTGTGPNGSGPNGSGPNGSGPNGSEPAGGSSAAGRPGEADGPAPDGGWDGWDGWIGPWPDEPAAPLPRRQPHQHGPVPAPRSGEAATGPGAAGAGQPGGLAGSGPPGSSGPPASSRPPAASGQAVERGRAVEPGVARNGSPAWPAMAVGGGDARTPGARRGSSGRLGTRDHPGPGGDDCGCAYAALQDSEQVARELESRLTALLETLPVAILGADAQGAVTSVNQSFCDLFELPELPADLLGTDCRMLVRPARGLVEDPADFAVRLELLLRRRRSVRGEEIMFSDGRVFERGHTVIHRQGEYSGHFWTYLDVTERRILEAETEGLIAEY